LEGTWLEKRTSIEVHAAQPAISDSQSVLQKRRDQPVSWTVQSQLVKGEKTRDRV
jgi:hypothetical protein